MFKMSRTESDLSCLFSSDQLILPFLSGSVIADPAPVPDSAQQEGVWPLAPLRLHSNTGPGFTSLLVLISVSVHREWSNVCAGSFSANSLQYRTETWSDPGDRCKKNSTWSGIRHLFSTLFGKTLLIMLRLLKNSL